MAKNKPVMNDSMLRVAKSVLRSAMKNNSTGSAYGDKMRSDWQREHAQRRAVKQNSSPQKSGESERVRAKGVNRESVLENKTKPARAIRNEYRPRKGK